MPILKTITIKSVFVLKLQSEFLLEIHSTSFEAETVSVLFLCDLRCSMLWTLPARHPLSYIYIYAP